MWRGGRGVVRVGARVEKRGVVVVVREAGKRGC